MKTVKLNYEDLKDIISEVIYKIYSKMPLNEYFIKRSKFVDNVWHCSYQIIENWSLVHYCTLVNRTETKEHWKEELIALLINLGRDGIKANNSVKTRIKAISEGFDYASLYDGEERILKIIKDKFIIEKVKVDDTVVQVARDCFESLDDIVKVIAEYLTNNYVREYVDKI